MKRHDLLPRMSKKEVPKTRKVDVLGLGMQLLMILSEWNLKALSESPHESTQRHAGLLILCESLVRLSFSLTAFFALSSVNPMVVLGF